MAKRETLSLFLQMNGSNGTSHVNGTAKRMSQYSTKAPPTPPPPYSARYVTPSAIPDPYSHVLEV